MLNHIHDLYRQGEISEEEYRSIKSQVSARLRAKFLPGKESSSEQHSTEKDKEKTESKEESPGVDSPSEVDSHE